MTDQPAPPADDERMPGQPAAPANAAPANDAPVSAARRARRLKSMTIFAVVIWSALVFLAWSQAWFTLSAQGRAGDTITVTVQGAVAAPALSALALAGLALAAALAIAGTVVRLILGVLEFVLGASILASSIGALANPVLAGQSSVTTATGVAGNSSIQAIATSAGSTLWPYLAVVAGALMALTGILIVVTLRRWPASGRKYQPVQFAADDGRTASNPAELLDPEPVALADDETKNTAAVDNWDSLSRGNDPTA